MEIDNIVKVTVGAAVVIIMIVAFAIPVMSGFTESSPGETGTNTPTSDQIAAYIPKSGTTFDFDTDTATIDSTNYQPYQIESISFDNYNISYDGSYIVRIFDSSETISTALEVNLTYDGSRVTGTVMYRGSSVSDYPVLSIDVYDPNLLVYTRNMDSPTWAEQTWVEWDESGTYYIDPDSFLFIGISNEGYIRGTLDNLTTYYLSNPDAQANIETSATDNESLEIIGFTTTPELSSTHFMVPQTYHTVQPVEPQVSGAAATIIDILPLIMVVGVLVAVVGAAGLFILNRRS